MKKNTHPDVYVEREERVAGIERGTLWNAWLLCPFSVEPTSNGHGFVWAATFRATDGAERQDFSGYAPTRRVAEAAAFYVLTKRIAGECRERARWVERYRHAQQLSAAAGVPLAS